MELQGKLVQGKLGSGAFQWNRGGWFGAQIGSTLWLVIPGFVLLSQSKPVGGLVVFFGVIANLVGLALWRRRNTVPPYPAVQVLIAACGVAALAAILSLLAADLSLPDEGIPSAWLLLIYPGLMLAFRFQEQSARRAQQDDSLKPH